MDTARRNTVEWHTLYYDMRAYISFFFLPAPVLDACQTSWPLRLTIINLNIHRFLLPAKARMRKKRTHTHVYKNQQPATPNEKTKYIYSVAEKAFENLSLFAYWCCLSWGQTKRLQQRNTLGEEKWKIDFENNKLIWLFSLVDVSSAVASGWFLQNINKR